MPSYPLPSLTEIRRAAALTDREGGRGPARQRRGWGGGGDSSSAAPHLARSRAHARLRRSPGPLAQADARPIAAGGGHGGRGAGAPGSAWLLGSLSGSQRRLLGRARPAVTSARLPPPRPPPLTPTSAEWRGRRHAARGAQPRALALRSSARSPPSLSRGVAAPFKPFIPLRRQARPEPPTTWEVVASRAAGWKPHW